MWRRVDDYAEWHFSTVDPTTGESADADATPTYRIYEQGSDSAVASGNAAKRDDANTVGYYCVRVQLTALAGFEVGKEYFCRAQATVGGAAGGTVIGSVTVVPDAIWETLIGGTIAFGTGSGAYTVTVTVTDGTDPVEAVTVRFTMGVDSYIGDSDADGEVVFNLGAGTYTVSATRAGYSFAGAEEEISADGTVDITLTAIDVGLPDEASQTRAYGTTRNAQGVAEPEIDVEIELKTPTTEGIHSRTMIPLTSDASGQVTVDLLRSATYRIRRAESESWVVFTTTDTDTYQLPVV